MIRRVETGGTKSRFGRSLARCVAGAIIVCGDATAQDAKQDTKPFDPKIYPAGVQKVLQQARDECKAESGGEVQFATDTVRALDLTGAGHTDYIVDLRDAACRDREAVYCGTGGYDLYILVTRPTGGTRLVFGQHVREYEVLPGNGARTIRFVLHGGSCGGHGNLSCIKTHRITGQPFKFVMPQ